MKHKRGLTLRSVRITILLMAAGAPTIPAFAQSQTAMNLKAEAARKAADQQMNLIWPRVLAAMKMWDAQGTSQGSGAGFAARTLDAQRKWLALRDEQCAIEQSIFKGGSMASMVGAQCETRMTRERTADLQALLTLSK